MTVLGTVGDVVAVAVWVAFIGVVVWMNLTEPRRRRDDVAGPVDQFAKVRRDLGTRPCSCHEPEPYDGTFLGSTS